MHNQRLAMAAIGVLVLMSMAVEDAQAATTLSPSQPDDGYRVGMAIRACSTTTMAATPAPSVLSPSGATTNPPKDTDNCVAWTLTEAGSWRLTYQTTGVQGTEQTMYVQVTEPDTLAGNDLAAYTLGMAALWLGAVVATRLIRDVAPRMLATAASAGLLALPGLAVPRAAFGLGLAALILYDALNGKRGNK